MKLCYSNSSQYSLDKHSKIVNEEGRMYKVCQTGSTLNVFEFAFAAIRSQRETLHPRQHFRVQRPTYASLIEKDGYRVTESSIVSCVVIICARSSANSRVSDFDSTRENLSELSPDFAQHSSFLGFCRLTAIDLTCSVDLP